MQLSDLLGRLSEADRAVLLDRRLGPNAVPLDNRALAAHLATANSLAPALAQLDAGQLLLLRWLAEQDGLRASWDTFVEALGDRISPELRDDYLRDLRLWGLADFNPRPKKGFFATFPGVISALPTGRDVKLRSRLDMFTSDLLLKVCQALGMSRPPTRKDERIDRIVAELTDHDRLHAAVDSLSEPARQLFGWLREQGGWVSVAQMEKRAPRKKVRYGYGHDTVESFWATAPKSEPLDPLTEAVRGLLIVPITPYAGSYYAPTAYAIANEVERAYSGRTLLDSAPLRPPPLAQAEQVEGTIPSPADIVRDIGHLLGFIGAGRCEWRQDGQPYKRSLVAFGKALGQKDTTYAETLWTLATGALLVREDFRGDLPIHVTVPLGERVTSVELFSGLVMGWVRGSALAAPGYIPIRAQQARSNLVQLLSLLPPDTWLLRSSIEDGLRFAWPMLFAPEYQIAGTQAPEMDWDSLGKFLLGLGTTADGQAAVMLPASHQLLLQPDADPAESILPPWERSWIVQPDRTIVVPPNAHPEALADLWQVAQLQSSHGASVFRVSAESISAAMNRGLTPTEIRTMLQGGSKVPLPPTVERLIDDQGARYGRIKVGTAQTYVKVDDPALLAELRSNRKLTKLQWIDVAPGVAFVSGSDPDGVLATLRGAGYLPVLEEPERPKPVQLTGRAASTAAAKPTEGDTIVRDRRDIIRLVGRSIKEGFSLVTTWLDREGRPYAASLEALDVHGHELHAYNLNRNAQEVLIPLDSIVEMAPGDPLYADDDDYDEDDLPPLSLLFPGDRD